MGLYDACMIIFLNGKYIDEREAKISVFDQGFLYGDGVYETMRTYRGNLWQVDAHMKRLEKSLAVAGIALPYSVARLIDQVRMVIRKNGYKEARVRVMVTRGPSASKGAKFTPMRARASICILAFPIPIFDEKKVSLREVTAGFYPVERSFPSVKTTSMFPLVMARMYGLQNGFFDTLLVDREGYVSEGAVSNVFVVKKGVMYTPRAGMLPGVTRDSVLRIARGLVRQKKLKKIVYCYFKKSFVLHADEVFLTNAPSGVVSVVKVGDGKIGNGKAGPVVKTIFSSFVGAI